MSEQEWAEGSGSTWESLDDGDPKPIATPADYSGEAHMDALQSWLRRPMGGR